MFRRRLKVTSSVLLAGANETTVEQKEARAGWRCSKKTACCCPMLELCGTFGLSNPSRVKKYKVQSGVISVIGPNDGEAGGPCFKVGGEPFRKSG